MRAQWLACASLGVSVITGCAQEYGHHPQALRGDPERGRATVQAFECGVCHVVPGVRGPRGHVGPPLTAYSRHVYVAGRFPNAVEYLVPWIRNAPALAPETAMPAFEMSESQAHDIAAYLYSLK